MTDTSVIRKPKTAADWKKAGQHDVVLPSGVEVTITIPNLPDMIKTGKVPNDLLDAALNALQKEALTPELMKEQADFFKLLVMTMVKAPVITEEDYSDLPYEDVELLIELGTRQRDLDALGHHIAGLHRSAEWRNFRGWSFSNEDVVDE